MALAYETEQAQDEQHLKLESLSEAVHTLDEQYAVIQEQLSTTQAQGREQYAAQQSLSASCRNCRPPPKPPYCSNKKPCSAPNASTSMMRAAAPALRT